MSDRDVPSLLTPRPVNANHVSSAAISPPDPNFLYLYDTVPTVSSAKQLFRSTDQRENADDFGTQSSRPQAGDQPSAATLSPRFHEAIAQQSAALSAAAVPFLVPDDIPKDELLRQYKKLHTDFLNLKNMSSSSLSFFQSDLETLIDDMAALEKGKLQTEQQVKELNALLHEARERERAAQQELVTTRDALRMQKDTLLESLQLNRLEIGDEEFALLAGKPIDALTLQERVQQKVWSLVHSVKATSAATAEHIRELTLKTTSQAQQLAQKQRIITEQEEELKSTAERARQQKEDYEGRCQRLNALLTEAHQDIASMTDKTRRYDDAVAKVSSLEEEVSKLRYEAAERDAKNRGLVERCDGIVAREHETEQRLRLLTMDKVRNITAPTLDADNRDIRHMHILNFSYSSLYNHSPTFFFSSNFPLGAPQPRVCRPPRGSRSPPPRSHTSPRTSGRGCAPTRRGSRGASPRSDGGSDGAGGACGEGGGES